MKQEELTELKEYIASQTNKKTLKDFRFWGGIVVLLLVVVLWGSMINFNDKIKDTKFTIDPETYAWDHVFHLFVEKYEYEKGLFADVESQNIVLKSMIDDTFYILHKDDMHMTYFQKAEIIRKEIIRRKECECED